MGSRREGGESMYDHRSGSGVDYYLAAASIMSNLAFARHDAAALRTMTLDLGIFTRHLYAYIVT
jgi:hypothetical protein